MSPPLQSPLLPLLLLLLLSNPIALLLLSCLSLPLILHRIHLLLPLLLGDLDHLIVALDIAPLDALLLVATLPLIVHLIAIVDVIVPPLALPLLGTIVLGVPHLSTLETVAVATQDLQADVASRHLDRLTVATPERGRRLTIATLGRLMVACQPRTNVAQCRLPGRLPVATLSLIL